MRGSKMLDRPGGKGEVRSMDIGEIERVIEIEPAVLPLPEILPMPSHDEEPIPQSEPARNGA